jgi:large subunit ribosomal protein L21
VTPNQTVNIDRIDGDVGSTVNLSVLMVGGDGEVLVGAPEVDGASVVAEIVEHGRGEKILVFKYKNKTRYRRRQGHRQDYTRIAIKEITAGGKTVRAEAAKAKPAKSRASLAEPEVVAEAAPEAVTPDASVETEAPKKPARTRKAAPKATPETEASTETAAAAESATAAKKAPRAAKPKAPAKPRARAKKTEEAAPEAPETTDEGRE